jgi:hypothetical protein
MSASRTHSAGVVILLASAHLIDPASIPLAAAAFATNSS